MVNAGLYLLFDLFKCPPRFKRLYLLIAKTATSTLWSYYLTHSTFLSLSLLSWWTIVVTVVPVVPLPAGWPAPPPPPGSASYPFLPNISYVMQLWLFFSPLLHNIQFFEKCYLNLLCNIWILLCDKQWFNSSYVVMHILR